ncbi:MAG: FIST signal transduction protein [Thermosynechococcaceae cyanobacterium]
MLKIAVGHSNDPDSAEAVNEVIAQCQADLAAQTPQAGILCAAFDFEHALILERIHQAFPGIELIGGTTDGEVSSVLGFQQDSLTLMLLCSDDIEIQAGVGRQVSTDPMGITQQAVQEAQAQLTTAPQFCVAIPESLTTSAASILKGLQAALGAAPVFGGATADQAKMQQTHQFYKTEVLSDAVPFLVFAGNVLFSHGVASGWRPMGKRSQVTKVIENTIYEIDHRPALEFYHYYLNDFAPDAAYPLAIYPPGEEQFFLRGAISHDEELGSITVSGDVPENAVVQITEASLDDVIAGSEFAFKTAIAQYPGIKPDAALIFSCSWRRYVLGTRTNDEYNAVTALLEEPLPCCGFYTFGEMAPFEQKGQAFFHNTTFVALLIGSH